jgi:hypothetical protein
MITIDVKAELAKLTPDGVTLLTATPQPTEHLAVDIEDPRTLG